MKTRIKKAMLVLAIAVSAGMFSPAQTIDQLPSTKLVVARMMEANAVRQSQMTGYTVLRRYVAVNKNRRAEMLVRVTCDRNDDERFSILSEEGSRSIRNHVFHKLLREEEKVGRHGTRHSARLIPANYTFQIIGEETIETGPAYVLAVSPNSVNKYSIDGRIWVDAGDYSIVRVEGQPAQTPSFWVRSVHFVHTYQKVGQFWLASSTRTKSKILIFGDSQLTIEDYDYKLAGSIDNARQADVQLPQGGLQP